MLDRAWTALRERFHGMHASVKLRKGRCNIDFDKPSERWQQPTRHLQRLAIAELDGLVALFGATLGSRFSMVQATMCHGGAPKALCIPT